MKRESAQLMMVMCLLTLLASSGRCPAQEKQAGLEEKRTVEEAKRNDARFDSTFKLLESRLNADYGGVVKGAPYSATAITERTQTLSDGNQIIAKTEATDYRDSEGRTRVDRTLGIIGTWTAAGEPPQTTMIGDPVAGVSYNLNPRNRTAQKDPNFGELVKQKRDLAVQQAKLVKLAGKAATIESVAGSKELLVGRKVVSTDRKKVESLGKQVIEGIETEGTRWTLTIPAGEIGNILPIEIIDERWYSPELQITVISKHHDPRLGDTNYRLTNISRNEPDRSLFQVPADYTILDGPKSKMQMKKPEGSKKPENDLQK